MAATLWDSFDHLLADAEENFLNYHFDRAVEQWQNYYRITAKVEYQKILKEITQNWDEKAYLNIPSSQRLFKQFLELRSKLFAREISNYTFNLYQQLLLKIYRKRFRAQSYRDNSLESAVFEYLCGETDKAVGKLREVLLKDPESSIARSFLSAALLDKHEQSAAVAVLSQNLFLSADQLDENDLHLSQFKMLLGRLHTTSGNRQEAAWLLTFEAWYRNYLIIEQDPVFFRLMQKKESNERILQVKYYNYERYRHFVRCLFMAEYARLYHKQNKGLIAEQENYMSRLDTLLFARYRRKRKPLLLKV